MGVAAVVLDVLALVMSVGATLALLGIAQGREPDLMFEWTCVWLALPTILLAQIVSIAVIVGFLHRRGSEVDLGMQ